jgi:2-haloacid dehalogenase
VPSLTITAVVFDLGGVLMDWDPRHLYRELCTDAAEMEDFLARVCTGDWHRAHDLGADIRASCEALAREHPGHRDLIMAWAERGEEMISGPIEDSVAVLADLRAAGMPCYALSNMETETFPLRRDRFGFMGWFDGFVISGLEGVAKPDRRIFGILLDRFGLDPARTVFIDDRPDNVAAAAAVGLHGLHFTTAGRLRLDLQALGALAPAPGPSGTG